jgi:hypothetical protein
MGEETAGVPEVTSGLLIPIGLASMICVASLLTLAPATAPVAAWVVAGGAVVGLLRGWREIRLPVPALATAAAVLLVFGAPVIFSGQGTFLGYIRLDDTATWLNVVDIVMHHGHSVSGLPSSTFELTYAGDVRATYPVGAFMLLGVGHSITGIDSAWIFQPYLACCAAAMALCLYVLTEGLLVRIGYRCLVTFTASQAALLYGYSLWGGIKEMTAAFLLALCLALTGRMVASRSPPAPLTTLPLAIAFAALICTLSLGAAAWVIPTYLVLLVRWIHPRAPLRSARAVLMPLLSLGAMTVVFAIPVWRYATVFLSGEAGLFANAGTDTHTLLGNLDGPLKAVQLAGIWPNGHGDFRLSAPEPTTGILIAAVLLSAGFAVWRSLRKRTPAVTVYLVIALIGVGVVDLVGSTPWVVGKTLAFCAPAILVAGIAGAVLLAQRWRVGLLVLAALVGAVLWSNYLQYHFALLAPRPRLSELQRAGQLIAHRGPTFDNEYEIYADRHFLGPGAPVEPAEYRPAALPTARGTLLVETGWADLDAFALTTLAPYQSLVTRRSPTYSRPPSNFQLVWQGRYYQLWQQPRHATVKILLHVGLGDQDRYPYCGKAANGPVLSVCPVRPVAVPPCSLVRELARKARRLGGELIAYEAPAPLVVRADRLTRPSTWSSDPGLHTLNPSAPGTSLVRLTVKRAGAYQLWLGGSFSRGFGVSIDGRPLGSVRNELANINAYVYTGSAWLQPGLHTVRLTFPGSNLSPGSGDSAFTELTALALEPIAPPQQLLVRAPGRQADSLCGRSLDWIEVVRGLSPLSSARSGPGGAAG